MDGSTFLLDSADTLEYIDGSDLAAKAEDGVDDTDSFSAWTELVECFGDVVGDFDLAIAIPAPAVATAAAYVPIYGRDPDALRRKGEIE